MLYIRKKIDSLPTMMSTCFLANQKVLKSTLYDRCNEDIISIAKIEGFITDNGTQEYFYLTDKGRKTFNL